MESISTRRAYMVRAKYQFNWKSPEKCKVITLVWIFKVIARKENNAPTALWGRTNRQVFINKDRKTTPKSWSLLYKMLSQLKTIYLFSAWNFFNSSSDVLFYFYAALISDIDREIVSPPPPQPAVLSMEGERYWSPDLGASLRHTRVPS